MWRNLGTLAQKLVAPDDAYSSEEEEEAEEEWESDEEYEEEHDGQGYDPQRPPLEDTTPEFLAQTASQQAWEDQDDPDGWPDDGLQDDGNGVTNDEPILPQPLVGERVHPPQTVVHEHSDFVDEPLDNNDGWGDVDDPGEQGGWNDDGLDDGWNEDSLHVSLGRGVTGSDAVNQARETSAPQSFADNGHLEEGWNDDSLHVDDSEPVATAAPRSPEESSLPTPTAHGRIEFTAVDNGWNDDSLHIDDSETGIIQETHSTTGVSEVAPELAADSGWNDDSLQFEESEHDKGAVSVPPSASAYPEQQATTVAVSSGWNDDSLDLDDTNNSQVETISPPQHKIAETSPIEPLVEQMKHPATASLVAAVEPKVKDTIQSIEVQSGVDAFPAADSPSGIAELPDERFETAVTALTNKTEENEVLKRELRSLQNEYENLQMELEEQASMAKKFSETNKQAISVLESQLQEVIQDKENQFQTLTETQRQLEHSQTELRILQQSSQPVVDQVTELQKSHEETLQRQYDMLDAKSSRIRELENYCRQVELEKTTLAEESLTVQHDLREQSEQLAAELLSVVQERDLLNQSLHDNAESMRQLQHVIETQGMDVSARQERLIAEKEQLESKLQDFVVESESIKETLKEVKLENGRLVQQLEDMTFESETLKEDLRNAKLENANLKANSEADTDVEQLKSENEELRYELERAQADFQSQLASKIREIEAITQAEQARSEAFLVEKETLQQTLSEETLRLNTELARLKEAFDSVSNTAKESGTECKVLKETIETLRREKMVLETQITEFEQKPRNLQVEPSSTLEDIQLEKDLLEDDIRDLREENASLRLQLEKKETRIDRSVNEEESNELQITLSERDQQITNLQQKVSSLVSQLEHIRRSAETENSTLQKEKETLRAEIETVVAENSLLTKKSNRHSQELEAAAEDSAGFAELKTQSHSARIENEHMLDELRKSLADSANEIARLNSILQDREQDYKSTVIELENMKDVNSRLTAEVGRLQETADFTDAMDNLQLEKDLLDDELKELRIEYERNEQELNELRKALFSQKEQHDELQKKAAASAEATRLEITSLLAQFDDLKSENLVLKGNADELQSVRVGLEHASQIQLQEQLTAANERQRLEANDLARTIEENTGLKMQLHDAKNKIEQLNAQLEYSESSLANSNTEMLAVAERQMQGHAILVEEFEREKEKLVVEIARLEQENIALKADIESKPAIPGSDNDLVDNLQLEKNLLENELKELRLQNASLLEQLEQHRHTLATESDLELHIESLQATVKELQRAKQATDDNLRQRLEDITSLTEENQVLERSLSENNQLLNAQLEEAKHERDSLYARLEQARLEAASSASELKAAKEKLQSERQITVDDADRSEFEDFQLEKDLLEDELKELQSQNVLLANQLEAATGQLQSTTSDREIQSRIEELSSHLIEKTRVIECQSTELERLQAEVNILIGKIGQKDEALSLLQSRFEQSEAGLVAREEALEGARKSHAQAMDDLRLLLEEDVGQLRRENAALLEQLNHAETIQAQNVPQPSDPTPFQSTSSDLEDLQLEKDLLEDDVAQLRRENAALVEQLESAGSSLDRNESLLEQQLSSLQNEYASLKANFDNVSTDLMSREMEIEELQEQLTSGASGLVVGIPSAEIQAEVERLKAECASLNLELEAVKADLSRKEAEDAENGREIIRLQSELAVLQQSQVGENGEDPGVIGKLTEEVESLTARYHDAETQRKQSVTHLAALGKSLKRAEGTAEEYKKKVSDLEAKLAISRDKLRSLSGEYETATNEMVVLKTKCTELKGALANAQNEVQALQGSAEQIAKLNARCNDLESEVKRYRDMEEFAAQQLDEVERTAQEQAVEYSNQVDQLRAECERLHLDLAAAQSSASDRDRLQSECAELRAEVSRLQYSESNGPALRDYEEKIAWYESELSRISSEAAQNQSSSNVAIKHLEDQVAFYRQQVETLKRESKEITHRYSEEREHLQQSLDEMRKSAIAVSQASQPDEHHRIQIDELEHQVEILEAECAELREQVATHGALASELDGQKARLERLLEERDAINAENEELLVQFGLVKQQMDAYEAYIGKLREEVEGRQIPNASELSDDKLASLSTRYKELELKCKDQEEQIAKFLEAGMKTSGNDNSLVEQLREQCCELSAELESTRTRLESTEASLAAKEQLISFQTAVRELDGTVQPPEHISRFVADSEKHLHESHTELGLLADELNEMSPDYDGETKSEQLHDESKMDVGGFPPEASLEDLRALIVSLAMALERSENGRADALGRLVVEREMHAKSLRGMSDNVKRFYSTVTLGEA